MPFLSRRSLPALVVALLIAAVASPLAAQTVRGRVADDSSGAPVTDVQIALIDRSGAEVGRATRSTDDGSFRINASGPGTYRLTARRIGYAPLTTADVNVGLGEVVTVEIRLTRAAQVIAPVRIVDRARVDLKSLMTTEGFDLRRARETGRFLDTDDMEATIELFGPKATVAALAEIGEAGMTVGWGTMEQNFLLDNRCRPHVYLDGFLVTSGGNQLADNAYARVAPIPASEIYGIEVYRKHEIPPASVAGMFGMEPSMDAQGVLRTGVGINGYTMPANTCGVIAVWTKGNMRQPGGLPGASEPAIRGTLVHEETGQPISGAIILLTTERGTNIRPATRSDDAGHFTVRVPTNGRYRLRAVHGNYDPVTTPPFVAAAGDHIVVELRLLVEGQPRAPLTIQQRTKATPPPATPAAATRPAPPLR